jgi:protein MpaA
MNPPLTNGRRFGNGSTWPILEVMDRRTFLATGAAAVAASASGLVFPRLASAVETPPRIQIGHSVKGRPIWAYRIGERDAPNHYVVMGQMHGDEPAGPLVCVNRMLKKEPIPDVALWVVPTMNPDGGRRGTRTNARGVDLNRNFPSSTWQYRDKGTRYYSGPRPGSEPETRAILRFFSRIVPRTVISIHQPLASVDLSGGDREVSRWLARNLRLPVTSIQVSGGGTMTSWYNREFPKQTAVTLELPPSTTPEYRRHVSDVLHLHARRRRG